MNPVHSLFNQSHQKTILSALLTAAMLLLSACGGSNGDNANGNGDNGGQSNPPVLTVPSNAFVFTLDVASTNTVAGSGGTPASCSIADLPAGLTATVAGNGCAISGTATSPLAQSSHTLTASNDDGTATITIDLSVIGPPVLTVPSNAFVFTVDVASTNTVAGSGGAPASCTIAGLPTGLTATVAGNGCAISGTATAPSAQSSYTLSASNDHGTATITIDLSIIDPPVLTAPSNAFVFTVDVASTNTVAGSGGTPAYCSIAGLPAGLTATVAGSGCAISGTATTPESLSSYTLSASNDDGTATITIDLSVIDPPVLTVPSNAFVFTVDVASTNTIAGSGGIPASCSIAGLPTGLTATVADNGCAISGTATTPESLSSYTLSASNDDGTATITIDLSVLDLPVLTVPSNAFVFTVDVASTNTVAGSGGAPASCSIAGLPAGLTATVAGNGCAISGTATAPSAQRSYTLSASNDHGMSTVTISLSIIIVPPVLAVPSDAFVFTLDVASSNTVAGSGSAPTSCSIAGLPAGLTATVAGNGCAISGTATTPLAQSSYILSASNAAGTTTTTISIAILPPVDRDGNGLIELYTLTQLHNMRYNLSGSSYKTSTADTGRTAGCPNDACIGYELMNDVELDADGDGQTWSQDSSGNYSLDSGDSAAPYFVIDSSGSGSGGWQPVGDSVNNAFNAIFDGNGYVIRNLAIRSELTNIGLFGVTTANAIIRNVGLVNNLSDYTGSSFSSVGGLVGWQNGGSITGSYATGNADGGAGYNDSVGGLVGFQNGGSITGSYATGNADGGDGPADFVGGLVGFQRGGSIRASYATGDADGGDGGFDYVGGLVGNQQGGSIRASYATGNADGGAGNTEQVGGLVGRQSFGGNIVASYATGNADGGAGGQDYVGGLVGFQIGSINLSASYSFGSKVGGEIAGIDGTPMPTSVTSAAGLTAANVGSSWNSANDGTLGAWDFGGGAQPPAVVFNDYDGAGTGTDYAALFAGYTTLTALIPNQRPASSPQIGTATTDIRLNGGDTANSISGNIDLPTAFNGENLTWSVFYDPAPTDSQVSVDNTNSVQVNAAHRSTARTFILRAVDSNSNIVNDYHLRIIE